MEFIDEKPVVAYKVRFCDRVEITEAAAQVVRDDNIIVWLVKARCLPPQYHPVTREGEERFRFNVQAVQQATPLDGVHREAALAFFDHAGRQGYLGFESPRFDEQGLFDPLQYSVTADAELRMIRNYLSELGEMHVDETVADAVQRIIEQRSGPEPEPEFYEPERSPRPEVDPGVEVVGYLRPAGTQSAAHKFLEEAFGPL